MLPTRQSVIEAMKKYNAIGREAFFKKVHAGREKAHYVLYHGKLYPLKAIWATAHRPPIFTKIFNTTDGVKGMRALGFEPVVEKVAELFEEGERMLRR